MFAGEMRKTYAMSLIRNFTPLPKGRPFPRIAEADIITGLHDRVLDPTKQHQGAACRVYQPPPDKIPAVDWVALASLRDTDNTILDVSSVDDAVSVASQPGEVAKWFRAIGYRDVRNDTNSHFCKRRKEIEAFDRDIRLHRDVCHRIPRVGSLSVDEFSRNFYDTCRPSRRSIDTMPDERISGDNDNKPIPKRGMKAEEAIKGEAATPSVS